MNLVYSNTNDFLLIHFSLVEMNYFHYDKFNVDLNILSTYFIIAFYSISIPFKMSNKACAFEAAILETNKFTTDQVQLLLDLLCQCFDIKKYQSVGLKCFSLVKWKDVEITHPKEDTQMVIDRMWAELGCNERINYHNYGIRNQINKKRTINNSISQVHENTTATVDVEVLDTNVSEIQPDVHVQDQPKQNKKRAKK